MEVDFKENEDAVIDKIFDIAKADAGIVDEVEDEDESLDDEKAVENNEELVDEVEAESTEQVESEEAVEEETEAVDSEKEDEQEEKAEEEAKEPEVDLSYYEGLRDEGLIAEGEYKTIEDYQAAEKRTLQQFKDVSQTFKTLFDDNPEMAVMMNTLSEGKSFPEALAESGILDLIPSEDDPDYEEFQKKIKVNRDKLNEKGSISKEFNDNITKSVTTVNDFYKESKEPELVNKTKTLLDETLNNFQKGIVTKDLVALIHDGLTHKAQLEAKEAEHKKELKALEVKIKNEKIVAAKKKIAAEPDITNVTGKSAAPPKTGKLMNGWFDDILEIEREKNNN